MKYFGTIESSEELQSLAAEPGDLVFNKEENKYLQYFDEGLGKPFGWRDYDINTDQPLSFGLSEYEMNKMIFAQQPPLTPDQINEAEHLLVEYFSRNWGTMLHGRYYMLLCNDIHYYTVLHRCPTDDDILEPIEYIVIELLQEKGKILSINYNYDETAIECWMRIDDECMMFLLFDYDWGIVTCQ